MFTKIPISIVSHTLSVFDVLQNDEKAIYRKLSEDDKARYKKEVQEYKRSQPNEGNGMYITH